MTGFMIASEGVTYYVANVLFGRAIMVHVVPDGPLIAQLKREGVTA